MGKHDFLVIANLFYADFITKSRKNNAKSSCTCMSENITFAVIFLALNIYSFLTLLFVKAKISPQA